MRASEVVKPTTDQNSFGNVRKAVLLWVTGYCFQLSLYCATV